MQNTIEKKNKKKNCGCLTIARIKHKLLPYKMPHFLSLIKHKAKDGFDHVT